ncbi:MAG: conjugal transfer protein TraF [Zhongshania sp.]|uniref:conjugal transfer protein TraF n=1 Tax=Zhongshania sp. TaxID=1971902 RepID=UPI002611E5E8|nr:conjugal transfer protein TraF [Zhongshania sp.]MDF1693202.1 conjugal transfer protein TraF [Zhongshania sp.]
MPTSTFRLYRVLPLCGLLLFATSAHAATGDYQLSPLHSNPAAVALGSEINETLLQMDGYIFVDDSDGLVQNIKDAYDEGRALQGRSRGLLVIPGDESALVESLEAMRDDTNGIKVGGHFSLSTQAPAWHIIGGSEFRGTERFNYDDGDANRLRFATVLGLFSFGELQSSMEVSVLWFNFLGANYRFNIDGLPNTQFGITAKLQNISLIERSILISEYDEEKIFDADRDVDHNLQLNADLGVSHQLGDWTMGLSVKDIYQQAMRSTLGTVYQQRSQFTSHIGYQTTWGAVQLNADLSPQTGFGEIPSQRIYDLNSSIPLSERVSLLLAYRWFDNPYNNDAPTIGLHYSLAQLLHITAQFSYAGNNELGGSINLQLPL